MAYNNKFISLKSIIESVYRDSGIDEINYETALEDAAEMVGLIGVPYTYIDKVTDGTENPLLEVNGYRMLLPADLVSINSMRRVYIDGDGNITTSSPMIESSDIYQYSRMGPEYMSNHVTPTASTPIMSFDEEGNFKVEDGQIIGEPISRKKDAAYKYKINNDVVYTDFEKGYVNLVYKAFPTDKEGFLMVPDDEKFRSAVKHHLIYKIDYRRWRAFPEKPGLKALLNDSEQRRDFYVAAARNKAHIPSIDKMEAIKNRMLRSIPKINEHFNGFKTLNNPEQRKF